MIFLFFRNYNFAKAQEVKKRSRNDFEWFKFHIERMKNMDQKPILFKTNTLAYTKNEIISLQIYYNVYLILTMLFIIVATKIWNIVIIWRYFQSVTETFVNLEFCILGQSENCWCYIKFDEI